MILSEFQSQAKSTPAVQIDNPPDALCVTPLSIALFSMVFFQRFSFNVGGYPFQVILVIVLAVMAYLLLRRIAHLDSFRLMGFLFLICILAVDGLISSGRGSITSLGLLLVIYSLNIFVVTTSRATYTEILRHFQWIMVLTAIMGIAQYCAQFFVPAEYLFSFKRFVPAEFLLPNFNTVIPIFHGSTVFKSNGFVFIEPATFSQYLAVAIIVELAVFHSIWRIAVYAFAYLLTYSGTGLIILATTLPLFLGSIRLKYLLAGVVAAGIVLAVLSSTLDLAVFLNRAGTFDNEHSSAFARFIGPWLWIRDVQLHDTVALLFGYGPGSVEGFTHPSTYVEFHDPTWAKTTIEYGVIGALVFFSYYLYCLFSLAHERRLNWALLVMFTVTGGALLNPFMAFLVLLLGIIPAQKRQAKESVTKVPVIKESINEVMEPQQSIPLRPIDLVPQILSKT